MSAGAGSAEVRGGLGGGAPARTFDAPLPHNIAQCFDQVRSSALFAAKYAPKTAGRYVIGIEAKDLRELSYAQCRVLVDQLADVVATLKGGAR